MQPARLDLPVVPGTTYRDTMRLMQPVFVYKPITAIAAGPNGVRLTVEHGLAGAWPVWVRSVTGMQDINRDPRSALPWRAARVDDGVLEINALSGTGMQPTGGELVYRPPVDLAGASVSMRFTRDGTELMVLTLGAGLESPEPGTVTRVLTPAQTSQLGGAWQYTLDVTFSDSTVTRFYRGGGQQECRHEC
ncbi:hypothetical protein DFO61_3366 [Ectopseudomonas oleovorans]|uniref:Uncharacterized protein n=1 Tax=Ectopseudomonas oleovorans TaxID=301 RepID=A0A397MCD6_ECTOL|nr:hypothetical protein [Pseudomonas oleovorans]RIA22676.1 hypothetical protein DFO61_3366 [Pseudomonas oleovorans]